VSDVARLLPAPQWCNAARTVCVAPAPISATMAAKEPATKSPEEPSGAVADALTFSAKETTTMKFMACHGAS